MKDETGHDTAVRLGWPINNWVNGVSRILRNDGTLALILPAATKAAFLKGAMQNRLPPIPFPYNLRGNE